jgi:hypothetical protein
MRSDHGQIRAPAQHGLLSADRVRALEREHDDEAQADADRQAARQIGGEEPPGPRLCEQDDDRGEERGVERRLERE